MMMMMNAWSTCATLAPASKDWTQLQSQRQTTWTYCKNPHIKH